MRTPLWTDARLEAAQRKHPQLPFAAWSAAVERLYGHKGHTVGKETAIASSRPVSKASGQASARRSAWDYPSPQARQGVQRDEDVCYVAREPLPESFSPYDYLYRFYRGCVALAVIDESHNGRGRDTDIAHAHHQAMLASQTRMLTSGTHFGGDILGFYHYWYRYHPQFWRRLGLGWNDADKALSRYGVIQEWTKEYESDARRGSGQTTVQVSTIPAPGLSAKLIPYLLEDMVYLTVLDVGAHMPPRIEIPEIVSMRDAEIVEALDEAEHARREATRQLTACKQAHLHSQNGHGTDAQKELECLQQAVEEASEQERVVQVWAEPRHLAAHYGRLVRALDDLARKRNTAARLAKGTVPRWFAVLPCDRPFEVWETRRDHWGDTLGRTQLVETERLAWEHMYPLERRLIALVQRELGEGRRVMLYVDQNDLRSTPRRLEWRRQFPGLAVSPVWGCTAVTRSTSISGPGQLRQTPPAAGLAGSALGATSGDSHPSLPIPRFIQPGEAGHDQALPGPGHRHIEDPPGLVHHPLVFQVPQEQVERTLLFLDIGAGQGQSVDGPAGNLLQEEGGGVVFTLQGLPVQKGEKHLVKLQPLGPVHRQDLHLGGLGPGVRRLVSLLEVEVGLDESGLGEPGFRPGQQVQVGPGIGHSQGAFPGGDPGPGARGPEPVGQDVGQRPPPHLAPGLFPGTRPARANLRDSPPPRQTGAISRATDPPEIGPPGPGWPGVGDPRDPGGPRPRPPRPGAGSGPGPDCAGGPRCGSRPASGPP